MGLRAMAGFVLILRDVAIDERDQSHADPDEQRKEEGSTDQASMPPMQRHRAIAVPHLFRLGEGHQRV